MIVCLSVSLAVWCSLSVFVCFFLVKKTLMVQVQQRPTWLVNLLQGLAGPR
jgi:hypothetical protein